MRPSPMRDTTVEGSPAPVRRGWFHRPQDRQLRRLLFQVHVWTGIGIGLYLTVVSVTGSVLVYRNELYRTFSPQPLVVTGDGSPLTVADLERAARAAYPEYQVLEITPGETPRHAVDVMFSRGDTRIRRRLHPFTGADLGNPVPWGFRATTWLLDLHDNLLGGDVGRRVNGAGALLLGVLCLTGAVIWWPGVSRWRRSLTVDRHANWKQLNWSLHSALGFWTLGFLLLWTVTGLYLSWPSVFADAFDRLEPFDETDPVERTVDRIQYWLAYLHFGRLGGRGIPGCGRGLCDNVTKAVWATVGLAPVLLFATGAVMWWNRVVRPAWRRRFRRDS